MAAEDGKITQRNIWDWSIDRNRRPLVVSRSQVDHKGYGEDQPERGR